MLINPFTPSNIASLPELFFGRIHELQELERDIQQWSVVIRGPVGIGKSSLLSQLRLHLEGFATEHKCDSVLVVGDRDADTVDKLARRMLNKFVTIDEKTDGITIQLLRKSIKFDSKEITRYYTEGRHADVLIRIIQHESIKQIGLLVIAVDEADKCPIALARLIRLLLTSLEQEGVLNVRLLLAGVSPYFRMMVSEDPGIERFFYNRLTIGPLDEEEAVGMLEAKFDQVVENAKESGIQIEYNYDIIRNLIKLSGGHPHLLQLLGSHVIEHENRDPDNILDTRDLVGALRKVVYEKRGDVYRQMIALLEDNNQRDNFERLLAIAERGMPTRISMQEASERLDRETLEWFVEMNILTPVDEYYALVDEFIRIRLIIDRNEIQLEEIERKIIESGHGDKDEVELMYEYENDEEELEYGDDMDS